MNYDPRKITLDSIADAYISIHVIDLKEQKVYPVKTNIFIDKCMDGQENLADKMNAIMDIIPIPEHRQMMKDFTNFSTIEDRLNYFPTVFMDFKGMIHGWCRARFVKVTKDVDDPTRFLIFSVGCVDEEKKRADNLLYLSQHDIMTGVYNRGTGEKMIGELLKKKVPGLFCLFDIDKFKSINDRYGHAMGDRAIISVAEALKKSAINQKDIVLRLGGDEFAAYYVGIETEDDAIKRINGLFENVRNIDLSGMNEKITISLGAVLYEDGLDFDTIYHIADGGVYKTKHLDGNSYTISSALK